MWFCGVHALHGRETLIWGPQITDCARKAWGVKAAKELVNGAFHVCKKGGQGGGNDVGTAQGS